MEVTSLVKDRDKMQQEVISMGQLKQEKSALEEQIARLNDELHEIKESGTHDMEEESSYRQVVEVRRVGHELSSL